VNLIQTNRLRTSLFHSSSYWNRIEKECRKLSYRKKKERRKRILKVYLPTRKRNLTKKAGATTLFLFEKTKTVTLIPFNHFPTVKGLFTSL
jgi:hypothetical protein